MTQPHRQPQTSIVAKGLSGRNTSSALGVSCTKRIGVVQGLEFRPESSRSRAIVHLATLSAPSATAWSIANSHLAKFHLFAQMLGSAPLGQGVHRNGGQRAEALLGEAAVDEQGALATWAAAILVAGAFLRPCLCRERTANGEERVGAQA
jgi:hypothetical protein